MFYRFKSKLATLDRVEAFVTREHKLGYFYSPNLERECEPFTMQPCKGLTLLRAPSEPAMWYEEERIPFNCRLMIHPGKEQEVIPDLWGTDNLLICSERFKQVVQQYDDQHEFRPTSFIDMNKNNIDKGLSYYWFNPRCLVKIETDEHVIEDLPFSPNAQEQKFFYQIFQRPDLVQVLSQLPIWRYCEDAEFYDDNLRPRDTVYFSEEFMKHLKDAALTGLDFYSVPGGQGEESVVLVNQ